MLIGVMGKMGTGKTLFTSAFAYLLHKSACVPLAANYNLLDAFPIQNKKDLYRFENGILVLDEAHLFLDSRLWKDTGVIKLTHWATKIRKKNLLVFVISQHIRQVDVRIRNLLDILIVCEKIGDSCFSMQFLDYQYGSVGRKIIMDNAQRFYNLYDTFEEVKALE